MTHHYHTRMQNPGQKSFLVSQAQSSIHIGPLEISSSQAPRLLAVIAGIGVLIAILKKILDTPSRTYDPNNPNVAQSYDTWEQ